jgi:hypothetical protein
MKTPRVATFCDTIKETIRAHLTLMHVFHGIPSWASVGGLYTIPLSSWRYGGIASVSVTNEATKFVGPHKSCMRQYIIHACSLGPNRHDEDITMSDTIIPSIELEGPITISWAQQLCHQVNSFLCSSANDLENWLLPNDLIVIRNQGVDHGEYAGHQEVAGEPKKHTQHGGSPSQFGIQESDFESNSEFRTTLPSNWRTGRVRPQIWVIYICVER